MNLNRADMADLIYFCAIARHHSFSKAAIELGVSASTLSHALKGFEARLGVRLLNRTTKSVTLTAAGESLACAVSEPVASIDAAIEQLNQFRDSPAGRIRLNVAVEAATLLLAPILPIFAERYPDIELDIAASNRIIDVTEERFDAGIRYGGTVPEDMVAQRLSADVRWVVAASPAYLARFGEPQHPDDLHHHRCVSNRLGNNRIYKWEFERGDEQLTIKVPPLLTVDQAETGVVAILQGFGLMYLPEPLISQYVSEGRLRLVLTDWASSGPGFYIYYSSRHQLPAGLRLLIDLVRELKPLGL
ncbi:LysR family transcriptional regulator [Klebsiella huaxiensis]|uniref:LysR family transcriptional regulator n=1 Tax=Klebsiella huaxiensis TaxID=2153354 RepID=A0ABT6ECY1_9ENTR|nr:LysR family transcriptional regulator [Klebsiella huaxiensis]MDG1643266.1 LysR family transcriptional regulator [Klebsiella huaxiensis]QBG08341.1 LysR family transcriptional regulator [Klebsiella huaxiensis]